MKPNLSFQSLAGTLAMLGTSALISACGGSEPAPQTPANATSTEVAPATGATASPTGQASCSAASCGAHKAEGAAADTKPADPTAPATGAAVFTRMTRTP